MTTLKVNYICTFTVAYSYNKSASEYGVKAGAGVIGICEA
jgi:hypothetical protein